MSVPLQPRDLNASEKDCTDGIQNKQKLKKSKQNETRITAFEVIFHTCDRKDNTRIRLNPLSIKINLIHLQLFFHYEN